MELGKFDTEWEVTMDETRDGNKGPLLSQVEWNPNINRNIDALRSWGDWQNRLEGEDGNTWMWH